MQRRSFLAAGLGIGTAGWLASSERSFGPDGLGAALRGNPGSLPGDASSPLLCLAPHFGMFRHLAGEELIDQLHFMADRGFGAVEDLRLRDRPRNIQDRIGRELARLGMHMGAFTATAEFGRSTFASGDRCVQRAVLAEVRAAVETARRVGGKWCIVVPGRCDRRWAPARQMDHAIDLLRRCAELCEAVGVTLLLEPLDLGPHAPPMFLRTVPQGQQVCRAVGSPACKLLFDVSEQHRVRHDLLAGIDRAWGEIGYLQVGDDPGRKEPGTGTIDFRGLFWYLRGKGYAGIVGMDHGNSLPGAAGERAVLAAYAGHDQIPAASCGRTPSTATPAGYAAAYSANRPSHSRSTSSPG